MKRVAFKLKVLLILGILALVTGGLIYALYRPQTYLSELFATAPLRPLLYRVFCFLDVGWIKYYFADYLWGFSLCCGLHLIFRPGLKGSLLCSGATAIYGSAFELLQFFHYITGTGDIWDILMFILAGLTVNMINFIPYKEKTT